MCTRILDAKNPEKNGRKVMLHIVLESYMILERER